MRMVSLLLWWMAASVQCKWAPLLHSFRQIVGHVPFQSYNSTVKWNPYRKALGFNLPRDSQRFNFKCVFSNPNSSLVFLGSLFLAKKQHPQATKKSSKRRVWNTLSPCPHAPSCASQCFQPQTCPALQRKDCKAGRSTGTQFSVSRASCCRFPKSYLLHPSTLILHTCSRPDMPK